ncbi:MAG: hypothetical protein AAB368_08435, partial [bacterium]
IQQRFEPTADDDWDSSGEVRQRVLEYYVVLDSVLRDKPQVRRLLAWCRHCGIPFIMDPRNVGREDLGCPFGCADLHRRLGSTERSVAYNRSPAGKLKRYQREEERKLALERSAEAEALQAAEVHPAATVEAAHDAVSGSVEPPPRDRRIDHPCPSPKVSPPATDPAASSAEAAACGPVPRSNKDCGGPSHREQSPGIIGGSPMAEPEPPEFAPGILSYVQFVISLLEGRPVHRVEILEMLARTKRQRSLAREKRIDYVLRRLAEEAEKPP